MGKNERNTTSVRNLATLLEAVSRTPEKYSTEAELKAALHTQAKLAGYSNSAEEICPSSLNTMKRICAKEYPVEGYRFIDELRLLALKKLDEVDVVSAAPSRRTKQGLVEANKCAQNERQQALMDCWHLTVALEHALNVGENLANESNDATTREIWRKERRYLLGMMSLSSQPYGDELSYKAFELTLQAGDIITSQSMDIDTKEAWKVGKEALQKVFSSSRLATILRPKFREDNEGRR